jgi:hypothetical protein
MSRDQDVTGRPSDLLPAQRQPIAGDVGEASRQLVVQLDVDRADEPEAVALIRAMQDEHFDLRRKMFLALVLDFGQWRDGAFQTVEAVDDDRWDGSVYADVSGWIVRLTRTRRVTQGALVEIISELKQLARRSGGQVRGLTVEDLRREDRWDEMATELQNRRLRRADGLDHLGQAVSDLPTPRLSDSAPSL